MFVYWREYKLCYFIDQKVNMEHVKYKFERINALLAVQTENEPFEIGQH